MSNSTRPLRSIEEDIKLITSNKLSTSQSKLLFMGIIYEIILRKDLFPRNSDLKEFVDKLFAKYIYNKEPLRDYLYLSRTLLSSRIQKDILQNLEYNQIIDIVNKIYEVFPIDEPQKSSNTRNSNNSELGEWMNFIREKDKNR